jgi:DNA-binding transcriptional ArsR family regulator
MSESMELTAADALRALAHPLRLAILAVLQQGESTSTSLARSLGESSGSTSYHLRQLARFGLVVEIPERGDRRDRWWRAAARHVNVASSSRLTSEARAATSALLTRVLGRDNAVVAGYIESRERFAPAWQDSAVISNHVLYLTAEELAELDERLEQLLAPYERTDPSTRPSGAERVFGVTHFVPWRPDFSSEVAQGGSGGG